MQPQNYHFFRDNQETARVTIKKLSKTLKTDYFLTYPREV